MLDLLKLLGMVRVKRRVALLWSLGSKTPPTFAGATDPMVVENWLLKMEKLLKVLHCTDSQKVEYATFALEGPAERWWAGTEVLLKEELGENARVT